MKEGVIFASNGAVAWLGAVPDWLVSLAAMIAAIGVAWGIHQLVFALLNRVAQGRGLMLQALVHRTRGPSRLAVMIVALGAAAALSPLPQSYGPWIRHLLEIGFIALMGWIALDALHVVSVVYSRRFDVSEGDNLAARRHLTQVRILERTAAAFILVLTVAAALMTFPAVRQYGISLLASAGAAGIIAGLALQPVLTNLIAGIQIAVTQPIRLDDAVVVDGEWGNIEEIGATYVVVRVWDLRRLIIPLSYFIQKPFQNWTRQDASLIGTVMFYVDYTAPLEAMREQLAAIVKASPRWDGKVANLQVTDLTEHTMQVRCLVSAKDGGAAWDLRCEVREKMIDFLRHNHPDSLPRNRLAVTEAEGGWRRATPPEAGLSSH